MQILFENIILAANTFYGIIRHACLFAKIPKIAARKRNKMFYDYLFSFYLGCKNIAPLNYTAHKIIPDISKIGAAFCLGIQLPVCLQRALYVVVYSFSSMFVLQSLFLLKPFNDLFQQTANANFYEYHAADEEICTVGLEVCNNNLKLPLSDISM